MKRSPLFAPAYALALGASCAVWGCSSDDEPGGSPDGGDGGAVSSSGGKNGSGGAGGKATGGGGPAAGGDAGTDAPAGDKSVALRFKAKVGQRDFACGETYSGIGSSRVTVTPLDLRFYVEEVWLTAGGERTRVTLEERTPWQTKDVALVDFEDGGGSCGNGNSQTNAQITGSAPPGNYDGVVFTIGVPEFLNHLPDGQFPPPLQPIYMLWSWLAGFKFFVTEVAQVPGSLTGDGGALDAGILDAGGIPGAGLLHVGSTGCYADDAGEKRCGHSNRVTVTLANFDTDQDSVVVDVAQVFGGVDLRVEQSCHSSGTSCPTLFETMGLDFATGKQSGEQRVFRKE